MDETKAGQDKLMRQSMQAGFNGGWAAACISIAQTADECGDPKFAAWLRERAEHPDIIEIVEIEPDWPCVKCGHEHATNMGGICVGCPCAEVPPPSEQPAPPLPPTGSASMAGKEK